MSSEYQSLLQRQIQEKRQKEAEKRLQEGWKENNIKNKRAKPT